jgi:hypothetical protein
MLYTRQYTKFLRPEKRIPRGQIRPRNIYRIITYKGGQPATKTAEESRYVFVIGIVGNKVHCIKINPIIPLHFTELIGRLRDKRLPLSETIRLDLMLKKFAKDGNALFDSYIKNNTKVYSRKLSNYRTYILDKIVNVYEIRFEQEVLENLFGERTTASEKREVLREEQSDLDEGNSNSLID